MQSADMQPMSEFTAWKIAASAIIFLSGCAWHNLRTGYRKAVDSSAEGVPDASAIWTPSPEPFPVYRGSAHAYTQQLIKLHLALGNEPAESSSVSTAEAVAVASR
jgi:hypothetical protein